MYQENLALLRAARMETLWLSEWADQAESECAPRPGKWSLGETLDHLRLAEEYYRSVFAKMIGMLKTGSEAVVNSSFAEVNSSIAFIPKSMLPVVERPFTAVNLLFRICFQRHHHVAHLQCRAESLHRR